MRRELERRERGRGRGMCESAMLRKGVSNEIEDFGILGSVSEPLRMTELVLYKRGRKQGTQRMCHIAD